MFGCWNLLRTLIFFFNINIFVLLLFSINFFSWKIMSLNNGQWVWIFNDKKKYCKKLNLFVFDRRKKNNKICLLMSIFWISFIIQTLKWTTIVGDFHHLVLNHPRKVMFYHKFIIHQNYQKLFYEIQWVFNLTLKHRFKMPFIELKRNY